MIVTLNEKREITSYVLVGTIDGGITIDDSNLELLEDFETEKYILTKNNEVVLNKDRTTKEE